MNPGLNEIVSCGGSIAASVNTVLLKKHTHKVDSACLSKVQWREIKQLHILGCDKYLRSKAQIAEPDLSGCYLDSEKSWLLVIGASKQRIADYVSNCTDNLEKLTVRLTTVQSLDLRQLTGTQELDLSGNGCLRQIEGLDQLHKLKKLDLSDTMLGFQLDLNSNPALERLYIRDTRIGQILLSRPLPRLHNLIADGTLINDGAFLSFMPALISFSINNTPLADLDGVTFSSNLVLLSLHGTKLRRIPDGVRSLKALAYFLLSNLTLEELPDWLPDWLSENKSVHIFLSETTVTGMDSSIFNQSWDVIRQWIIERKFAPEGKPLNELKVVFLGDGGAGKSYTIARLMADGEQPERFPGISTPGIVIKEKEYTIDDRKVQIHFWDFGGQEILHSMHRMFLTDRTLYVVLLNVRDGTQDERARYWLHNIKSFAPKAPVLVVLNQIDENPNASINENDLKSMAPSMTETVKMSALKYAADEFNAVFTAALLRQIGKMSETLDFFFPAAWSKVKQSLQDMESHYIHGADYTTICEECGVKADSELRKALLQWFNDLGVSFCYSKDAQLKDYVILRPDWLTNAIYMILFNKLENVHNGIVPLQTIYKLLNPDPNDRDKIRRVLPDVTYTQDEVSYVLNVIRRFRLSFQVNRTEEFIPMLCDRNSLPIAAEYEKDPNTLEFRMEYDYLPNNVLHRLMVQLRGHLDTDNVWLTGARFEQQSTGLSAVVKSEGNDLRILVRSTKKIYPANTYLSFIKDELDRINRDMGLTAPANLVIYKADGIAEEFDYEDLLNALEDGEDTYRSRIRRKRIPIMDILNQTGHTADQDRDKLLQDIISACMSMQSQKLYWHLPDTETHSKENLRNDYLRELLRAKGYIASDQSRSGRTQGGSQAGLLDLDIRRSPDVPWTILEALNISKADKKDTVYWDNHLKKLLDYYNPMELPYLFLVSYLECSREEFVRISSAYNEHMRWNNPQSYEHAPSSFEILPINHGQFISASKCTYDRGGIPTTVYHICVRLGD